MELIRPCYYELYILLYLLILVRVGSITWISQQIAGTTAYYNGENVSATSAVFYPAAIWVDSNGVMYMGGSSNDKRIRKISSGIVSTFIGIQGTTGTGSTSSNIALSSASVNCVAIWGDTNGNLFYIDIPSIGVVRTVDAGSNTQRIIIGGGSSFLDGSSGTSTSLATPLGLWGDTNGNLFIADQNNNRIRKYSRTTLIIDTVAGGGSSSPGDGGLATSAVLSFPKSVFVDSLGNILFLEGTKVRKVDISTNIISTVATTAGFYVWIWFDSGGNLFYIDSSYYGRKDASTGTSVAWGRSSSAGMDDRITGDSNGNVYFSSTGRVENVTVINMPTFSFSKFAGGYREGVAMEIEIGTSTGLWGDTMNNFYFTDSAVKRIRKLNNNGITSLVAGTGNPQTYTDGLAGTASSLALPSALWGDTVGNLYFVNSYSIAKMTAATTVITTFAGNPISSGSSGNNTLAINARFSGGVLRVFGDTNNNLYISESNYNVVRKINLNTNIIFLYAGTFSSSGFSGDGGYATSATLNSPNDIWVDKNGRGFIADLGNNRIRMVYQGIISTLAGTGTSISNGYTHIAAATNLKPHYITGDTNGNLYVCDNSNFVILMIYPTNATTWIVNRISFNPGYASSSILAATSGSLYFLTALNGGNSRAVVIKYFQGPDPTGQPSRDPTGQPSRQPVGQPSGQPTRQPSQQPTSQPSRQPTSQPSIQPTGQPTSSPSFLNHILAYYSFTGDTKDKSPNGRDCVNIGGIFTSSQSSVSSNALSLSGASYLDCGFKDISADNFRTVAGFIKLSSLTGIQEIWSKSLLSQGIELVVSSNQLCAYAKGIATCSGSSIVTGIWYHVVVTHSGSTLALYLNGVIASSILRGDAIGNSERFFIGNWNDTAANGARYFNGVIDHLVVLDQCCSSEHSLFELAE